MLRFFKSKSADKKTALPNISDVICLIDRDGLILDINPASTTLFGFDPHEMKGRYLLEFVQASEMVTTFQQLSETIERKITTPFQNQMKRKDGSLIDVRWSVAWSELDECFSCVGHEVTDMRMSYRMLAQSEDKLRTMLESMPVGLIIVDQEGHIEVANSAAQRIFELSEQSIQNKKLGELCYFPSGLNSLAVLSLVLSNCNQQCSLFARQHISGRKIPIEVSARPYGEPDKYQYLLTVTDISERHALEMMKQQFLSTVSHEVRSPLTSLQAFLVMLTEGVYGDLPETARSKIEASNRSVKRIIGLVNDLLDLEKMEAGKFDFRFAETDTQRICSRAIECIEHLAQSKRVSVESKINAISLTADEERIAQVLVNFLSNAIRFSPEEAKVTLTARDTGTEVEVTVSDCGPGMAPEQLPTIFERYGTAGNNDGKISTGLGLAICKSIVELHQGCLGVESQLGKGSSFWIRLPKGNKPDNT